jgi:triosephosphate isomerase
LQTVHAVLRQDPRVALGAQNCHWEDQGAFTGEVSAPMLKDWCSYTLVGHSERRNLFNETDEMVRAKLEAVLRAGMRPLLAVGETAEERRLGQTRQVLVRQARAGLMGLPREQLLTCTVAYEPVWAIGAGAEAAPADIAEAVAILREVVEAAASGEASSVRILYGGSVTGESAAELLGATGVAGALVGGASLRAPEFCAIAAAAG